MQILMIVAGAVAVCDTIITLFYSRMNTGMAFPAALGLPMLFAGILYGTLPSFIVCTLIVAEVILILIVIIGSIFIIIRKRASAGKAADADAVIVLGYSTRNDIIPGTLKKRVECAFDYITAHPSARAILSGGTGSKESRSEADIMYDYMISLGAEPSRLTKESKSHTTEENFVFSMKLIDETLPSPHRVCFITTGYHVPRAECTAHKLGFSIPGVAARGVCFITPNDYIREVIVWIKLSLDHRL